MQQWHRRTSDHWPEYSEHSERDEGAAEVLVVGDAEADVVRHDGDDVDDRHDAAGVLAARRRRVQPQQVLGGEDEHAGRVQAEERVGVALAAHQRHAGRHQPAADRLRDVRRHRRRDEKPAPPPRPRRSTEHRFSGKESTQRFNRIAEKIDAIDFVRETTY